MKSAILAILFPFAAVAAALTPDTIKDDIPGTATISEIVTAGGSARPADVHRIVDGSFNGGTQEVNRVTGAFDSKANKTDISADNPAFSNAVNAVVENKANKSEVDALANSAVVTNALTVATTNRVALLESSKADKADISATDPTFSNAVMEVTQDFKTNTYTKTETDALIAANKPEYEDVPSNVVWRIEAEGGRFFFKPVRPIHTKD